MQQAAHQKRPRLVMTRVSTHCTLLHFLDPESPNRRRRHHDRYAPYEPQLFEGETADHACMLFLRLQKQESFVAFDLLISWIYHCARIVFKLSFCSFALKAESIETPLYQSLLDSAPRA
jgi:hypothetical protein